MKNAKLTWDDNNSEEVGHRIYRSTSPMDPDALPAGEIDKLFGYAAWKWGLVDKLPANHPYKIVRSSSAAI